MHMFALFDKLAEEKALKSACRYFLTSQSKMGTTMGWINHRSKKLMHYAQYARDALAVHLCIGSVASN